MFSCYLKWHLSLFVIVAMVFFLFFKFAESRIVTFESQQSKNFQGVSVLNQIKFEKQDTHDVWQMRQSHSMEHFSGVDDGFASADFIEIDLNTMSKSADYRQFQSGDFNVAKLEIEYGVSCGTCHSNGPRLIRPNWNSVRAPLNLMDKVTIVVWNLRIKTYGQVSATVNPISQNGRASGLPSVRSVPFALEGPFWNAPLKIKSCTLCHQPWPPTTGSKSWVPTFLRRNELTRQNFGSIRFLRQTTEMPPPLHNMEPDDQKQLDFFLGALPL